MSDQSRVRVPPRGSPAVSRAVAILNLMAERPDGWSLTQIASELGLAKSSTLTILTSLEDAGMVSRSESGYELDVGALGPAGGYLRGADVVTIFRRQVAASPLLSGQIAHLAVLVGREVTYVARHLGRPPLPVTAEVGDRFPAAITAVGAALLAGLTDEDLSALFGEDYVWPRWTPDSTASLPELLRKIAKTRKTGYALNQGETHPHVFACAMVVRRVGNHAQDLAVSASLIGPGIDAETKSQAIAELRAVRDTMELGNDLR